MCAATFSTINDIKKLYGVVQRSAIWQVFLCLRNWNTFHKRVKFLRNAFNNIHMYVCNELHLLFCIIAEFKLAVKSRRLIRPCCIIAFFLGLAHRFIRGFWNTLRLCMFVYVTLVYYSCLVEQGLKNFVQDTFLERYRGFWNFRGYNLRQREKTWP